MVHRRSETGTVLGASARLWHVGAIQTMRELLYRREGRTFELRFSPMSARTVLFDWKQIEGAPLPSLHGTITIGRFGPLHSYLIRATMSVADDLAGQLLRDSVASQFAEHSLRLLTESLRAALR